MVTCRAVRPDDLEALYRVALATGDGGDDAAALYQDPRLLGHIYAAPYAVLSPENVFVAEDGEGAGGYIVGAVDTEAFAARLETAWWPALRARHAAPDVATRPQWSLDQRRIHAIHHPPGTPRGLLAAYPSHLHINLLPRLRGRGVGQALLSMWLEAVRREGSRGVHLAVGNNNTRAIRFYQAHGFHEPRDVPPLAPGARWMVLGLPGLA